VIGVAKPTPRPLGRVVLHDPRSFGYPYPVSVKAPVSVHWKRHAPVFDQGSLGSCTGNACLGALGTSPLFDALGKFSPTFTEDTAVALYSAATKLDTTPGSYPPDDTGSSGLAVAKAAKRDGWLSGYRHAFSFSAALSALAVGPVIVGVNWYEGFDTPTADGECKKKGSVRGGHELCCDQLDMQGGRVWFTNSWSVAWGQSGRAWWSFATFKALLAAQGDCTILTPLSAPKPPIPAPDPAPSGCLPRLLHPFRKP